MRDELRKLRRTIINQIDGSTIIWTASCLQTHLDTKRFCSSKDNIALELGRNGGGAKIALKHLEIAIIKKLLLRHCDSRLYRLLQSYKFQMAASTSGPREDRVFSIKKSTEYVYGLAPTTTSLHDFLHGASRLFHGNISLKTLGRIATCRPAKSSKLWHQTSSLQ